MTTITCDICNSKINTPIRVTFKDGEHPHNGSTMYKTSDVCDTCLNKFPHTLNIRCDEEFDDVVRLINKQSR